MNVDELRRAFTLSDSITARIRKFREDRIRIIQGGDEPLPLQSGARVILHIVPLTAFVDPLDLQFHHSQHQGIIMPFGAGGFNYRYTLDGYITYSGMETPSEAVRAYALMFRAGAVEMAASSLGRVDHNGRRLLNLTDIESFVTQGWQRYMMFAKFFGIEAPFYVFLSMLHIKGFEPEVSFFQSPSPIPSRRDLILFPEVEVAADRLPQGPGVIFARLFDTLANAFGLMQSSNTMIPRS
jgi:hypothetical protein